MTINYTRVPASGTFQYNELTHTSDYYSCGYVDGTTNILLMNINEECPTAANTVIRSSLVGFGNTVWADFIQEISNQGLTIPI